MPTAPGIRGGGPMRGSNPTSGVQPTSFTIRCCSKHQSGSTFQHSQGWEMPSSSSRQDLAFSSSAPSERAQAAQFPIPVRCKSSEDGTACGCWLMCGYVDVFAWDYVELKLCAQLMLELDSRGEVRRPSLTRIAMSVGSEPICARLPIAAIS